MPMLTDGSDPLGVAGFATHHLPLEQAPARIRHLQEQGRWLYQADGCIKVVLRP
jgi:hypothetical protein